MTLTTHAIIGASVAQFFPQAPVLGFVAALASHYVADVIPHYDVGNLLPSIKRKFDGNVNSIQGFTVNKQFFIDGLIVFTDMLLGILLALLFWHSSAGLTIILVGALGGLLPDLLQIVYSFWRTNRSFVLIKKVHDFMHSPRERDIKSIPLGIISESSIVLFVVAVCKLFS